MGCTSVKVFFESVKAFKVRQSDVHEYVLERLEGMADYEQPEFGHKVYTGGTIESMVDDAENEQVDTGVLCVLKDFLQRIGDADYVFIMQ